MKIKDILKEEKKLQDQKKLALEQVLNLSKPEIILNKEKELTKKEYKTYQKIIKKLQKNIPIQYITHKAFFYGKEYYVNKNVLIPRPETESLVQDTLTLIDKYFKDKNLKVIDIGTGSGIIAITLNKENNHLQITATDISNKALKVAKKNQKNHQTNIKFINTDLYKNIKDKFDVLISNPPYINENSKNIQKQVLKNEPHLALFGGKDGLDYYRNILKNIKSILKENHIIAFEIGENQGKKIQELIKKQYPKDKVIIKKDYNGFDRYIYSISQIDNT
ncbi:MAG: peptide chain release factor N(5)-glutamine methyltransferase [Bacilli bacterium]